jgi:hypothetical protein
MAVAWSSRRRGRATRFFARILVGLSRVCIRPERAIWSILRWSYREKWDQIGDFGPLVMTLDEAFDFVAKDPMGSFWR